MSNSAGHDELARTKLSRTPGSVPPLAQRLGAATDAVRRRLNRGARVPEERMPSDVSG